ncbi:MAG: DUF559 domain-containing protein [Solirubrobacterales bacterium]
MVECDGHDFHERTPHQARRDRERDRKLQAEGFLVFRYPGTEIWRDAFGAAREAVKLIMDRGFGGDGLD